MADTKRSVAALKILLADNTSQDISPQDVRDFLVSALGVNGGIHWSSNVTAQSCTQGIYTKAINASANMPTGNGVTADYTNSQLILPIAGVYKIFGSFSVASSVNNVVLHSEIFLEGVGQGHIEADRKIANAGDVGSFSLSGLVTVDALDTVDLRFDPDKTTSITISHAQLWAELAG